MKELIELIELILLHQLTAVIVGFFLGFFAKSIQDRFRVRKLIFKELAINFEQTNLVVPPLPPQGEELRLELAPALIAAVGESLQTVIYEGNIDKLGVLRSKAINKVVDAYRTIYQFKRLSTQLRDSYNETAQSLNDTQRSAQQHFEVAVTQATSIAYGEIRQALELMSSKKADNLFKSCEDRRGNLINIIAPTEQTSTHSAP